VWDVLVFVALLGLWQLQRRRAPYLPAGSIFLAYLVLYSLARLPLEGFRVDSLWVMNMRVAQLASGALIVVGGLLYALRLFQGDRQPAAALAVPSSGPVLAITRGEMYLQPSAQYLIAASRGGQPRPTTVITAPLPGAHGKRSNGSAALGLSGTTAVLPIVSGLPVPTAQSAAPPTPSAEPGPALGEATSAAKVGTGGDVAGSEAIVDTPLTAADSVLTPEQSIKTSPDIEPGKHAPDRSALPTEVASDSAQVPAAARAASSEEV
jgi:hypothetical protein